MSDYAAKTLSKMSIACQDDVARWTAKNLDPKGQSWEWFHKYPADVLSGKIPACKTIIQAARRHFIDNQRDDIYLCMTATKSIMTWFTFTPIPDGENAGQPMTLDPPLIWMTISLIGWRWTDDLYEDLNGIKNQVRWKGKRRYKECFALVARKFTKTTWSAAMMLYLIKKGDFRPRAYTFATQLEQAKEVWKAAASMIDLSPNLRSEFSHNSENSNKPIISMPSKKGSLEAKASNSDKQDGLNPIGAVLDECHAVTDYNVYGVISSAFGAQPEYLYLIVTTAGFILDGLCTTLHKTGCRVLNPEDDYDIDTVFYAIFQIDKEDSWEDENAWFKANPSTIYGRPSISYLRTEYKKATTDTQQKAQFLTKHCNMFVNSADVWLDFEEVKECSYPELDFDDYIGRECYVGVDRAMVGDITSFVPLFPDPDGGCTIFPFNLQSRGAIKEAGDYLRGVYMKAEAADDLEVIGGQTVRDNDTKEMIRYLWKELSNCKGFYYDPWHMKEVALDLEEEGIPMIAVSQGTGNMSEPAKKLESLIKEQLFRYNGSVLFEFATTCAQVGVSKMGNMQVFRDSSNYKTDKIDPLIATIIALSGATLQKQDQFIYNDRGMIFL